MAVLLVISLALATGPAAVAGGGAAGYVGGTGADTHQFNTTFSEDGSSQTPLESSQLVVNEGQLAADVDQSPVNSSPPVIDPNLENASGNQSVLVGFDDSSGETNRLDEDSISSQRGDAETAQEPLEAYANTTDGVDFKKGFWIANAATMTVDSDRAEIADVTREIAEIDGVAEIRAEDEIPVQASTDKQSQTDEAALVSSGGDSAPYNLEQTNVTDVWDGFHTKGEGSTVAVLDSGVDDDHPDIDLEAWKDFTTDPSDEPTVYDEHGTLVSGVATGANESGTPIGVAPEANLMHGAVVSDCDGGTCTTSESAVLSGIEWAVENDADAVSISLGWYRYSGSFISAVETANDAGTVVVGASGNQGADSSLTPGNVYDALSVGAANESAGVASFSSGEEIDTGEAWGSDAPKHWPETYTTPDIVAPGVGVESTIPDGEYRTASGTSIATPHVAGAVALVQSATAAELEAAEITDALRETAWKPDDACPLEDKSSSDRDGSPSGGDENTGDCLKESDTRYGNGIVDVYAAIDEVGTHATVDGTVTDRETNEAVPNATVLLSAEDDTEFETETGTDGAFAYTGLPGEQKYTVSLEADGYDGVSETSDVPADETTTIDSALSGDGDAEIELTDDHFDTGIGGGTVELVGDRGTYAASHVENGTYTAVNVPSLAEYELRVDADGYANEDSVVSLESAGDRINESYALEGDAILEITAETGDGEPVDGATLSISVESGDSFEPANRTDENGMLEVTVPGTGDRYTLEATDPEAGSGTAESDPVESQSTETVTVELSDDLLPTPGFGIATAVIAVLAILGTATARNRRAR
ncbi:S8 family serine peptidase [Halostagnicola sp. A-GB9-2]|uniref:S8 family serine peptidase n=1 Tax=Halostagnicola sp. A-GB9-2 TaxID=3048066 RepID=UPI0024BFB500|nr:S8 family serine peptidase [Halostagnicola sp. A-GB9-2]MDJ1432379.1 S8 family serine peptidase [Halostagnicola sp. A-GB9-2]